MIEDQWDTWQVALLFLGIVAAWSGIIIAALRVMFTKSFAAIEDKIAEFRNTTNACNDLEREFMEFKAELPIRYVMREDFIRFEVGINYKLDKLRDLFLDTFRNSQENKK